LFCVCFDHPGDCGARLVQGGLEACVFAGDGIGGAGGGQPLVDLGADQLGIGE
jgi:hypothetical protein